MEGIEPDWWAKAVLDDWLIPPQTRGVYQSGLIKARNVDGLQMLDVDPPAGLRILAATPASLIGLLIQRPRNDTTLTLSRWIVGLDHITLLDADWATHVDLRSLETLDLSPTDGLRMVINLDTPLGDFGPQIELPLDWGNDYGGNPDPSVLRFAKALHDVLGGFEPALE